MIVISLCSVKSSEIPDDSILFSSTGDIKLTDNININMNSISKSFHFQRLLGKGNDSMIIIKCPTDAKMLSNPIFGDLNSALIYNVNFHFQDCINPSLFTSITSSKLINVKIYLTNCSFKISEKINSKNILANKINKSTLKAVGIIFELLTYEEIKDDQNCLVGNEVLYSSIYGVYVYGNRLIYKNFHQVSLLFCKIEELKYSYVKINNLQIDTENSEFVCLTLDSSKTKSSFCYINNMIVKAKTIQIVGTYTNRIEESWNIMNFTSFDLYPETVNKSQSPIKLFSILPIYTYKSIIYFSIFNYYSIFNISFEVPINIKIDISISESVDNYELQNSYFEIYSKEDFQENINIYDFDEGKCGTSKSYSYNYVIVCRNRLVKCSNIKSVKPSDFHTHNYYSYYYYNQYLEQYTYNEENGIVYYKNAPHISNDKILEYSYYSDYGLYFDNELLYYSKSQYFFIDYDQDAYMKSITNNIFTVFIAKKNEETKLKEININRRKTSNCVKNVYYNVSDIDASYINYNLDDCFYDISMYSTSITFDFTLESNNYNQIVYLNINVHRLSDSSIAFLKKLSYKSYNNIVYLDRNYTIYEEDFKHLPIKLNSTTIVGKMNKTAIIIKKSMNINYYDDEFNLFFKLNDVILSNIVFVMDYRKADKPLFLSIKNSKLYNVHFYLSGIFEYTCDKYPSLLIDELINSEIFNVGLNFFEIRMNNNDNNNNQKLSLLINKISSESYKSINGLFVNGYSFKLNSSSKVDFSVFVSNTTNSKQFSLFYSFCYIKYFYEYSLTNDNIFFISGSLEDTDVVSNTFIVINYIYSSKEFVYIYGINRGIFQNSWVFCQSLSHISKKIGDNLIVLSSYIKLIEKEIMPVTLSYRFIYNSLYCSKDYCDRYNNDYKTIKRNYSSVLPIEFQKYMPYYYNTTDVINHDHVNYKLVDKDSVFEKVSIRIEDDKFYFTNKNNIILTSKEIVNQKSDSLICFISSNNILLKMNEIELNLDGSSKCIVLDNFVNGRFVLNMSNCFDELKEKIGSVLLQTTLLYNGDIIYSDERSIYLINNYHYQQKQTEKEPLTISKIFFIFIMVIQIFVIISMTFTAIFRMRLFFDY